MPLDNPEDASRAVAAFRKAVDARLACWNAEDEIETAAGMELDLYDAIEQAAIVVNTADDLSAEDIMTELTQLVQDADDKERCRNSRA